MWPTPARVPVRALSFVFLVVVGVAVAAASLITGSLLCPRSCAPAATALTITARPHRGSVQSPSHGRTRDHVASAGSWLLFLRGSTWFWIHDDCLRWIRGLVRPARRLVGSRRERGASRSYWWGQPAHLRSFRTRSCGMPLVAGTAIGAAWSRRFTVAVLAARVFSSDGAQPRMRPLCRCPCARWRRPPVSCSSSPPAVALGMGAPGPRGRDDVE